jgi:hypothetical protein
MKLSLRSRQLDEVVTEGLDDSLQFFLEGVPLGSREENKNNVLFQALQLRKTKALASEYIGAGETSGYSEYDFGYPCVFRWLDQPHYVAEPFLSLPRVQNP